MTMRLTIAGLALLAAAGTALALDPDEQRGQTFAQTNCARCHAIGPTGTSPFATAPPFRTLHEHYPVEDLAEALAEGIVTGHPSMPQFKLDRGQIGDLIRYLKTLEPRAAPAPPQGGGLQRGG